MLASLLDLECHGGLHSRSRVLLGPGHVSRQQPICFRTQSADGLRRSVSTSISSIWRGRDFAFGPLYLLASLVFSSISMSCWSAGGTGRARTAGGPIGCIMPARAVATLGHPGRAERPGLAAMGASRRQRGRVALAECEATGGCSRAAGRSAGLHPGVRQFRCAGAFRPDSREPAGRAAGGRFALGQQSAGFDLTKRLRIQRGQNGARAVTG